MSQKNNIHLNFFILIEKLVDKVKKENHNDYTLKYYFKF